MTATVRHRHLCAFCGAGTWGVFVVMGGRASGSGYLSEWKRTHSGTSSAVFPTWEEGGG
jgi:hypothetical protein